MVIDSDDDDSDDEYTDVTGSLVDMTSLMAIGGFRSQGPASAPSTPTTRVVTTNGLAVPPPNGSPSSAG